MEEHMVVGVLHDRRMDSEEAVRLVELTPHMAVAVEGSLEVEL